MMMDLRGPEIPTGRPIFKDAKISHGVSGDRSELDYVSTRTGNRSDEIATELIVANKPAIVLRAYSKTTCGPQCQILLTKERRVEPTKITLPRFQELQSRNIRCKFSQELSCDLMRRSMLAVTITPPRSNIRHLHCRTTKTIERPEDGRYRMKWRRHWHWGSATTSRRRKYTGIISSLASYCLPVTNTHNSSTSTSEIGIVVAPTLSSSWRIQSQCFPTPCHYS
jgi:hypothetical protein